MIFISSISNNFFSPIGGVALSYYLNDKKRRRDHIYPFPSVTGKVFATEIVTPGQLKPGIPTYTLADVAAHNSTEKGIWVTYKNGVYNITDYVRQHPGGKKILMAAGKSLEPFWNIYSVHKSNEVFEIMESFRIGNVTEIDKETVNLDAKDPYKNDPERSSLLIPSSKKPFNAEPPSQLLVDNFITPAHLFFVRNHLPVPLLDEMKHTLEADLGFSKACLTVADLKKKFRKKSTTAVTQCAGNRRSEMVDIKPVRGLNWGNAAISNAKWSGVSLNDFLLAHKVDIDQVENDNHVIFRAFNP